MKASNSVFWVVANFSEACGRFWSEVMRRAHKVGVKMASPMNVWPAASLLQSRRAAQLYGTIWRCVSKRPDAGAFSGPESCKAADHTFRMATTHSNRQQKNCQANSVDAMVG